MPIFSDPLAPSPIAPRILGAGDPVTLATGDPGLRAGSDPVCASSNNTADCCCGPPPQPCPWMYRAALCRPDDGCWTLQHVYLCSDWTCSNGQPVGPGTVILWREHCWTVEEGPHYHDCSDGSEPGDGEVCIPAGGVIVDDSTWGCVTSCNDARCFPFTGYVYAPPCPGGGATGPVVFRCSEVIAALNLGCGCPSGCLTIGDPTHPPYYPSHCYHASLGGPFLPDVPPGFTVAGFCACSCCDCNTGNRTCDPRQPGCRPLFCEYGPPCNADGAHPTCADGRGLSQHTVCHAPTGTTTYTNDHCCCDCDSASGTFSGTNTGYDDPPYVTCPGPGGLCFISRVSNGFWNGGGRSLHYEYTTWNDDGTENNNGGPWDFSDTFPLSSCNGCYPSVGMAALYSENGTPSCGPGTNGTFEFLCNTSDVNLTIQSQNPGNHVIFVYSYHSAVTGGSGRCGGGDCGSYSVRTGYVNVGCSDCGARGGLVGEPL